MIARRVVAGLATAASVAAPVLTRRGMVCGPLLGVAGALLWLVYARMSRDWCLVPVNVLFLISWGWP